MDLEKELGQLTLKSNVLRTELQKIENRAQQIIAQLTVPKEKKDAGLPKPD